MLGVMIYDIIFFAIPAILIIFLGISIYRYRSAKKRNEEVPGTYSAKEMKQRKISLIIGAVTAVVLLVVVIGFIALFFMAIAFM